MASANYIAAAKQANRQPTTYMSVEDASGQTLYYTSQGQWDGSDVITEISTDGTQANVGDAIHLKRSQSTSGTSQGKGSVLGGYGQIWTQVFTATYDHHLNNLKHNVTWPSALEGNSVLIRAKITNTNPYTTTPTVTHYTDEITIVADRTYQGGDWASYNGDISLVSIDHKVLNGETWWVSVETFSNVYGSTWILAPSQLNVDTYPTTAELVFLTEAIKPTAQIITTAIDFGADTTENPIFSVDDVTEAGATLTYTYSYATAAAPSTFISGGTIIDGDSLISGAQYYKIQIDFVTTNGARGKVREIQLKEGIFRYYGSHIAEPFDGVSPQIVPDSVSSFSQKIKLDKGLSTTGEASVRLFWVPETSDLIASGYLKGKDVAIYSGFVGLDTASYEPVITGTWYDHDLDEVNGIITVKIRDAFKQFEKRKIPEEVVNTTTGAITTSATATTWNAVSLVTVMKQIFDLIGLRDRYLSPDFDTLEAGDYAAAKYKVSRTISKPKDFGKLLDELAITGAMYLIPLGNGQIKPKPFDINQEHIAILDADEVKFTGLKGNISEFYSRFYAYYNPKTTLTDDPDDDRDDYDNATALIDANAELRWFPERGTKQHFDKWKVGRTSATTALTAPPAALNDLASLWNSLFTEPLYTVKAVNLGPRFADIEPADVVQVDNLRLPVVDDVWVDSPSYNGDNYPIVALIILRALTFNSDGTKLYTISDAGSEIIFQHSLTTPFDINTASSDSKELDISTEAATPRGMSISPDGTKAFVLDQSSNKIYRYGLTTADDISTGTYDTTSLDISSQTTTATGMFISEDGLTLIVSGGGIFQYAMTTAFDLTTASYSSLTFSTTPQDASTSGVFLSDDGRYLFVNGFSTSTVYKYRLNITNNVSSAVYESESYLYSAQVTGAYGLHFDTTGSNFYIGDGGAARTVYQYNIPNPWILVGTSYTEGDRLVHDGKMWRARQDNSGKDPTSEATFWQDMEISAEGYTQGKHFFVLGRKFNPNTAQIDLDLMEMPPGTLGGFDSGFDSGFDT
jgi:sugar lactone lactonase YvrE